MKVNVAAAAPDILPENPGANLENILACIRRAREDEAVLLVLPALLPEDINMTAVRREAGPMPVYPLTAMSLSVPELAGAHDLDILCCSADTPATAESGYGLDELAALTSHDKQAAVLLAAPMGGDGSRVYTGQCVIAQNGFLLQSAEGYAIAEIASQAKGLKAPEEGQVTGQSTTPWTPLPEALPRILRLQREALCRKMQLTGTDRLSLSLSDDDAASLWGLIVCAEAMDKLGLPRENLYAAPSGPAAKALARTLNVQNNEQPSGLAVDTTDLTARALYGKTPAAYGLNATLPRSVIRLLLRGYAATCGSRALSIPLRAALEADTSPWGLYDFLLYFAMAYGFPEPVLASLLEDAFQKEYDKSDIQEIKNAFFRQYHRPAAAEGPVLFKACL